MASNVSSSSSSNYHPQLLRDISLNFSRITDQEDKCFMRLERILQDRSCYFTVNILPAVLELTVSAFPLYTDQMNQFEDLIEVLLANLKVEMDNNGDEIDLRIVPYRFYTMVNEFLPDKVAGTVFSFDSLDPFDVSDNASTVLNSLPGTPDPVSEGPGDDGTADA